MSRPAELDRRGIDCAEDALSRDRAAHKKTVVRSGRVGGCRGVDQAAQGNVGRRRADQQRRRTAELRQGRGRLGRVDLTVAVFVRVTVDIGVGIGIDDAGKRRSQQHAIGDVAADRDQRASLQSVVRWQRGDLRRCQA